MSLDRWKEWLRAKSGLLPVLFPSRASWVLGLALASGVLAPAAALEPKADSLPLCVPSEKPVPEPRDDGALLDSERWKFPFESRDAWLAELALRPGTEKAIQDLAAIFSAADFARWRKSDQIVAERITYRSEGLAIKGFVVRPAKPGRHPVVLYNHGGTLQWGRITFAEMLEFHRLAERGYVVMASYYRGEGGSEGQADMGGGDVRDTLSLIQLAAASSYADTDRIGMIGSSRGGGVTYGALACTDAIDAAVVIGAPADHLTSSRRAEFDQEVYPHTLRDYARDKDRALKAISALYFADRLSPRTPLLILHGGADPRVAPTDSLAMAERLQRLERPYRLKVYEGGSHSLEENYTDVRGEIDRWLDLYVRDSAIAPANRPPPLDVD